jgi:hypothetical protein
VPCSQHGSAPLGKYNLFSRHSGPENDYFRGFPRIIDPRGELNFGREFRGRRGHGRSLYPTGDRRRRCTRRRAPSRARAPTKNQLAPLEQEMKDLGIEITDEDRLRNRRSAAMSRLSDLIREMAKKEKL